MKPNTTFASVFIVAALIVGAILLSKGGAKSSQDIPTKENVSIVDSTQVVSLTAKGGYAPIATIAKAGMPTVLRFNTNGTFDCSSFVRIPSMGITKVLPNSGATDIDLGSPHVGTLQGICGMGMYRFSVEFQN
jgi:plastocyanin domain-containing protein